MLFLRQVAAAAAGSLYAVPIDAGSEVRADTEAHRLRSASSLSESETKFAWRQLLFEKLLQADLSDWSVTESHGSSTLSQAIGSALREYRDVRVMEDSLHGSKLIAVLDDGSADGRRQRAWNVRCPSYIDFSNFNDHVVPALAVEKEEGVVQTVGYDIGDILMDVSGTEDSRRMPAAGGVANDTVSLKMGAAFVQRTVHMGKTTLTQHFASEGAGWKRMIAAFADGSFASLQRVDSVGKAPRPDDSGEGSADTESGPGDEAAANAEQTAADPTIYDGRLKSSHLTGDPVVIVGTPAGLEVSVTSTGNVRQRLLSSNVPRIGRHLDIGTIACEASRTYLKDGGVIRCFHSRSVEVLTANGTLHRRAPNGDWTTTFPHGARTTTTSSGETSEMEALRVTTRTDPVNGSVVRTRSDKVVMVQHSNGSSATEYPDGTRVYTASPDSEAKFQYRVECLGMGRVLWTASGVEVVLPTGCRITRRDEECDLTQADGTKLKFKSDGTSALIGPAGTTFTVGLTQGDDVAVASADGAGGPASFRLFEVFADGSGDEILPNSRATAYAAAVTRDISCRTIENPVPGCANARSVTYVTTTPEENAFTAAYSEASILPISLQRRAVPYSLQATTQSKPAQIVRQLVYNEPLANDRHKIFTSEVAAFLVAAETSIPANVPDDRTTEEVSAATQLADIELPEAVSLDEKDADVLRTHAEVAAPPPASVEVKESATVALHDSLKDPDFLKAFRTLTAPPPAPPKGFELIDPAMKTFDDWFRDGRTSKSLDLQLASTSVPKYWDSEEFHRYIEKNGPIKQEKAIQNVETTVEGNCEDAAASTDTPSEDSPAPPVDLTKEGGSSPSPADKTETLRPPGTKYEVLPPIAPETPATATE